MTRHYYFELQSRGDTNLASKRDDCPKPTYSLVVWWSVYYCTPSSLIPYSFLNPSSILPYSFLTPSLLLPHYFLTSSSLLPPSFHNLSYFPDWGDGGSAVWAIEGCIHFVQTIQQPSHLSPFQFVSYFVGIFAGESSHGVSLIIGIRAIFIFSLVV